MAFSPSCATSIEASTCAASIDSRIRNTSDRLSSTTSIRRTYLAPIRSARKREIERRPLPRFGFDPNPPVIALHDALANRQADAGARVLLGGMQPLEQSKNVLLVLRLNSDAVVANAKHPRIV